MGSMIPMTGAMTGFSQFQNMLKEKNLLVQDRTDEELGKLAFRVEAKAKEFAPVKTGRLRASIMTEHIKKHFWIVGTNVTYAPMQEFGSGRNPPHPYLRPALMSVKGDLHRLLARADLLR